MDPTVLRFHKLLILLLPSARRFRLHVVKCIKQPVFTSRVDLGLATQLNFFWSCWWNAVLSIWVTLERSCLLHKKYQNQHPHSYLKGVFLTPAKPQKPGGFTRKIEWNIHNRRLKRQFYLNYFYLTEELIYSALSLSVFQITYLNVFSSQEEIVSPIRLKTCDDLYLGA